MKGILLILAVFLILSPVAADAQKWIETHRKSDGTVVEGHWQTPEEARQAAQAKPGPVPPYSGQFPPYPERWGGPGAVFPHPLAPQPPGPVQPGAGGYGR